MSISNHARTAMSVLAAKIVRRPIPGARTAPRTLGRSLRPFPVLVCLTMLALTSARAGSIRGSVRASGTKEAIVGANVSLPGTGMGAVTDANGEFFVSVFSGRYSIRVSMLGYETYEQSAIEVPTDTSEVVVAILIKESMLSVGEVVVRARANRELETSSRLAEKLSNSVINVIGAQTIEQSTDRTIADALNRVSGLSVVRDHGGEGRYVIMRGLEQKYNNTLVDGIKIPSPESKSRFVPLDIFPSGLFERVEVTKALTPDIAGDAIGGSTNLMLRDAPERFVFAASAATGSSSGVYGKTFDTFNQGAVQELDPDRAHGSVSDSDPTKLLSPRYNATSADFSVKTLKFQDSKAPMDGLFTLLAGTRFYNNLFGIIASGSYQNTYNRVQTDFYGVGEDVNTVDTAGHLIPYATTYDNRVYSSHKMRGGVTVKADYILDTDQLFDATYLMVRQEEVQTLHGLQTTIDGSRGSNDLTYSNRSALRTQTINSFSVGGHQFTASPISFNWLVNSTDALQDRPDEAQYTVLQNYDPYGHLQPFKGLGAITHVWRKNDDKQLLGKIDATVRLTSDGAHTIQLGFLDQKLNRANFQNDYKLNPALIHGSTQPFTTIDSAKTSAFGSALSGNPVYGYQNYKADEKLLSAYFQYTLVLGDVQVLAGVRWEQAKDTYFTAAAPVVADYESHVTMVNLMPGVHLRYAVASDQVARISFTRTMSRPNYFDLVPASDRSDNSQTQGNPRLRPALATNLDIRYEYYPNALDLISVGFFAKRITDPIEDQFSSVGVVFVTSKANGNPATVDGYEAVASKHLGDFGLTANYTYVVSKITNAKLVPRLDPYGDPVQPVPVVQQTRPLQSQSPQIFNVTLSFQDADWGTGMNLSYNYTGRRLLAVAHIDGYDTYERGSGTLDFSGEQGLFFGIKMTVKLINLLNSQAVTEVASGDYIKHAPIVIQRDLNRFRGSIGVAIKL